MTKNKQKFREPVRQRIEQPKISRGPKGEALIMCPFCVPSHVISMENNSSCGTLLQIRAVQTVIMAKYDKRFVCIKCQKGGGEMVQYQDGLIHTHNCSPGTFVLNEPPKLSKLAEFAYKNPAVKGIVEKLYGTIVEIQEVLPRGERTGKILGYHFYKVKKGKNNDTRKSEHIETIADQPVSSTGN